MIAVDVRQLPWTGPQRGLLNAAGAALATPVIGFVGWLGRVRCGLSGHMMVRHFEPRRVSLACLRCGEETPGWRFEGR